MKTFKRKVARTMGVGLFLQELTKLAPGPLADAAIKGALWIQRKGKGKVLRERSLDRAVEAGDLVILFYDEKILKLKISEPPQALFECAHYGVWVKPAGMLAQGTQTGDHTSLLRFVEERRDSEVFLVHRLDRETRGLMIVAYSSASAARLTSLFAKHEISKTYHALVLGEIPPGTTQTVSSSLDGKEAVSHFTSLSIHHGKSLLEVTIETGRLHQIRRHLESVGHPVIGDPKYGRGNKNKDGLQLLAYRLSFTDPWERKLKTFEMKTSLIF